MGRAAQSHYDCMSFSDIARLDVGAHAADDCHLFFWITGPFLAIGAHIQIMKAWGFEPTAMAFVWLKTVNGRHGRGRASLVSLNDPAIWFMGLGHTTRQNAEYVILGRRGNPPRLSKAVRQVITEPIREHSRKPEQFFERVQQYCDGPRLELFGRQERPGWIVRGNEVGRFHP